MARSRAELGLALAGAVAASVGDLALLWVAWAADGRLGIASPPEGTLVIGHYLGVLGIPLYALGYRALADGIREAAPRAARWVVALGAVGSVVGAVVHGLTGALTAVGIRTGGAIAPDELSGEFETLNGDMVTINGSGEEATIGDEKAQVLCGGVVTANATVYIIDTVMMP